MEFLFIAGYAPVCFLVTVVLDLDLMDLSLVSVVVIWIGALLRDCQELWSDYVLEGC